MRENTTHAKCFSTLKKVNLRSVCLAVTHLRFTCGCCVVVKGVFCTNHANKLCKQIFPTRHTFVSVPSIFNTGATIRDIDSTVITQSLDSVHATWTRFGFYLQCLAALVHHRVRYEHMITDTASVKDQRYCF